KNRSHWASVFFAWQLLHACIRQPDQPATLNPIKAVFAWLSACHALDYRSLSGGHALATQPGKVSIIITRVKHGANRSDQSHTRRRGAASRCHRSVPEGANFRPAGSSAHLSVSRRCIKPDLSIGISRSGICPASPSFWPQGEVGTRHGSRIPHPQSAQRWVSLLSEGLRLLHG